MTAVSRVMEGAERQLSRERATTFGLYGLALWALLFALLNALNRFGPGGEQLGWPWLLLIALVPALAVAAAGWASSRPSASEVARIADRRLGGRDRLATLLEYASVSSPLARRQRDDAERWAASVDLANARGPIDLLRPLALTGLLVVIALLAAVVPVQRPFSATDDATRAAISELQGMEQTVQGADPTGNLQAILQRAENDLRNARNRSEAAAVLAGAARDTRDLIPSDLTNRQQALLSAGSALTRSSMTARVGAMMQSGNASQASTELRRLAQGLPKMSDDDRSSTADALASAADAAAAQDPALATELKQAANALQNGKTKAAQSALEQAAQQLDQLALDQSAAAQASKQASSLDRLRQDLAGAPGQLARGAGGSGGGGGNGAGGGSSAQVNPGLAPNGPNVYVPGVAGTGSGQQAGLGQGSSSGTSTNVLPYQQVYSQYQQATLDQVQQEDISQQDRDLIQRYFDSLQP